MTEAIIAFFCMLVAYKIFCNLVGLDPSIFTIKVVSDDIDVEFEEEEDKE